MTDQELLNFMREQFDNVCFGDTGYLEETCLDRLAAGVSPDTLAFMARTDAAPIMTSARKRAGTRTCIWKR